MRQRAQGKLWVRERLSALLDKDSFIEVGSNTGSPVHDDNGELKSYTPASVLSLSSLSISNLTAVTL